MTLEAPWDDDTEVTYQHVEGIVLNGRDLNALWRFWVLEQGEISDVRFAVDNLVMQVVGAKVRVGCDWGRTNGFVDCAGDVREYLDGWQFCQIHGDCAESDGVPMFVESEKAKPLP